MDLLIKKDSLTGYRKVFPKTFLEAIKDRESGRTLIDILNSFNMYFLPYVGDKGETRVQLPEVQRRRGVWLTYVLWDDTIVAEFYNGDSFEDDEFKKDSNWIEGSNRLIGDVMISSEGTWVINGKDSGLPARGETGIAPIIRAVDNKLQVSHDRGENWEPLDDNPIITKFRVNDNKLELSYDLGETWSVCSEYIAAWFRIHNNKLEISRDSLNTWEVLSDYIAAYFRWSSDNRIQISRDNVTWEDLSPELIDGIYIRGYFSSIDEVPSNAPLGSIYMIGPGDDGHYNMYIKTSDGWMDNGAFTSFQAGVAQDLSSDSENMVPSVKAVNHHLNGLIFAPTTVSEYESMLDEDKDDNTVYLCVEDDE